MNKIDRDHDYIDHILQAIGKIELYVDSCGKDAFVDNGMLQDAVIRNLEIIGEAVSKLSESLKSSYSDIPWRQISGMRNRLIHAYMSVNLDIVWNTTQIILPEFKTQLEEIQSQLTSQSD